MKATFIIRVAPAFLLSVLPQVSAAFDPNNDPDDQISEAHLLSVPSISTGALENYNDVNMYRLVIASPQTIAFQLTPAATYRGLQLNLFDATGQLLGVTSLFDSTPNFTIYFRETGTYYLGASDFPNGALNNGAYYHYDPVSGLNDYPFGIPYPSPLQYSLSLDLVSTPPGVNSAAQQLQLHGQSVQALFQHENNGVLTTVIIQADQNVIRNSAGKFVPQTSMSGSIDIYDFNRDLTLLAAVTGPVREFDYLENFDFYVSPDLSTATLNARAIFGDAVTATIAPMDIAIAWTATESPTAIGEGTHFGSPDDTTIAALFSVRAASAVGTVSGPYGGFTNLIPDPSIQTGIDAPDTVIVKSGVLFNVIAPKPSIVDVTLFTNR